MRRAAASRKWPLPQAGSHTVSASRFARFSSAVRPRASAASMTGSSADRISSRTSPAFV
jgi:hypothetical protein